MSVTNQVTLRHDMKIENILWPFQRAFQSLLSGRGPKGNKLGSASPKHLVLRSGQIDLVLEQGKQSGQYSTLYAEAMTSAYSEAEFPELGTSRVLVSLIIIIKAIFVLSEVLYTGAIRVSSMSSYMFAAVLLPRLD